MMDHLKIGVVDALRARAAAIAAANPRHAKRILGERAICTAVVTAPIVLAGHVRAGRPPAKARPIKPAAPVRFRKSKYPWRTMGLNQFFDADGRLTRRCVLKQAGVYRRQMGRQYDVKLLIVDGRTVIRVTRTA